MPTTRMKTKTADALTVAAESGCDASVLRLVAAAYPKGATHESVRHRLRAAFDANDVATIAAVGVVAALVTFEVYHQWRLGSNKDIDISAGMPEVAKQRAAMGKRRRSSHIISPDQGSVLPCEPLVQLLLASGVEAERLLLEAAASPTAGSGRPWRSQPRLSTARAFAQRITVLNLWTSQERIIFSSSSKVFNHSGNAARRMRVVHR